ncbi:hypothetical protein [Micromonospora sp. NPDC047740]|uniref:hypothetical protein n=1 Tax=Micromonospora sp. NPDC047740 TaxID=3364254 RepID=UPI00371F842A
MVSRVVYVVDRSNPLVVPTRPVDAVWHPAIQISEPCIAACMEIAGHYVHHRSILTEAPTRCRGGIRARRSQNDNY